MSLDAEQTLHLIQEHNNSANRILHYYLADRGFFAEVTFLARVMVYAVKHNYRLVIDNSDFSHRANLGWDDYFQPFCETYSNSEHAEIAMVVRFGDARIPHEERGDGLENALELLQHYPDRLELGGHTIEGVGNITGTFVRAIYRLNERTQGAIDETVASLGLTQPYDCLHIRRGDKVGDEDVWYPCSAYYDRLEELEKGQNLFVMSDDYGAIAEARQWIADNGLTNRVVSLTSENHRGFDIGQLRAQENFFSHDSNSEAETHSFSEYLYDETVRLLTEVEIARRSRRFVGTLRSNIFKAVRFVHNSPSECFGLG